MDWYEATFERGLREPPPFDLSRAGIILVAPRRIVGTDNFEIEELFKWKWEIQQYTSYYQHEILIGAKTFGLNRKSDFTLVRPYSVGFHGSIPIIAKVKDGKLRMREMQMQQEIDCGDIRAEEVMAYEDRIYVRSGKNIYEMIVNGKLPAIKAMGRVVGNCTEYGSKMYPGVVVQSLLGMPFVSVFPKSGHCWPCKLPELKDYRIIDAKFDHGILMVAGEKVGKYDRFVFAVHECDISKAFQKVEDIAHTGLNFVVKDNGVCVHINEDEQVEIFHRNDLKKVKVIEDPEINAGMKLFTDGGRVLFADGKKLFSISIKK